MLTDAELAELMAAEPRWIDGSEPPLRHAPRGCEGAVGWRPRARAEQSSAHLAGNADVVRVLAGLRSGSRCSEYAAWIAVLVYAYAQGGATPLAWWPSPSCSRPPALALVVARVADRCPASVLRWGYVVQAAGAALTATPDAQRCARRARCTRRRSC